MLDINTTTLAGSASGVSHREADENYAHVVAVLNERWRVIKCKDRIQWILQYTGSAAGSAKPQWTGKSFCRTHDGLMSCVIEKAGTITPDAHAKLMALPSMIGGEA